MTDVKNVTQEMMESYNTRITAGVERGSALPDRAEVILALKDIRKLFFPAFFAAEDAREDLEHFAEAILNNRPSPLGIKEALAMTLPGIYAALSARDGGALKEIRYPWSK